MFCQQRKLRMQFHVPNPRYDIISPYTDKNITKFDLDMRRKAEVLKHTGAQKSNQVNKLSKAQLFAQVVRGYSPAQKLLGRQRGNPNGIIFCDSSMNRVLTSSSDVPGPIRSLYLDESIPLYNYAPPENTFSENIYENDAGFRFFVNVTSTLFFPGVSQNIGALEILNKIPNEITNFNMIISCDKTLVYDPKLFVTYGGSPVFMKSDIVYHKQTPNLLVISNILLNTTAGTFFEFALQFSEFVNIDPDTIRVEIYALF